MSDLNWVNANDGLTGDWKVPGTRRLESLRYVFGRGNVICQGARHSSIVAFRTLLRPGTAALRMLN
jgi:hypothetical protein